MSDQPIQRDEEKDPGYASVFDFLKYSVSVPERAFRAASGLIGGTLRESASLLVPRAFQDSKSYSVMVRQMLDFLAEDIGGVARSEKSDSATQVENYVARKAVGNFIDMAGLATMHLSPLMFLAIFSDVAYGSKAYLRELAGELKEQGVIDENSTIDKIDDLLEALAQTSKTTATAFDTPPLSIEGLRETVRQTRESAASVDPTSVLPQAELNRLWSDIHDLAKQEGVNPFAISSAATLYSLDKIGTLGRGALSTVKVAGSLVDRHVIDHYREALADIRNEGLHAALARTSKPYTDALWHNFSSSKPTITEDVLSGKLIGRGYTAVRRWLGGKGE